MQQESSDSGTLLSGGSDPGPVGGNMVPGRSVIGSLIRLYKKALNRLLYPVFASVFQQQAAQHEQTRQALADLTGKCDSIAEALTQLRQMSEARAAAFEESARKLVELEKNFLEQNHYRYTEHRELEQNFFLQNHTRHVEIQDLKHSLHRELQHTRQQLTASEYSQIHLRNVVDALTEELREHAESLEETLRLIETERVDLLTLRQEIQSRRVLRRNLAEHEEAPEDSHASGYSSGPTPGTGHAGRK